MPHHSRFFAAIATVFMVTALAPAIAQDSGGSAGEWRYTTEKPADGWEAPDFDDSGWKTGRGGFGGLEGEKRAPGGMPHTEWTTDEIWIRQQVEFDAVPERPALLIHHDEDAEVYLNGKEVATFEDWSISYNVVPLDDAGRDALQAGTNTVAVHCRQTGGGQYIDVHVIDANKLPDLAGLLGSDGSVRSDLITEWGEKVTADNAWREYPRPQLTRENWTNLNGHWNYAITMLDSERPSSWMGEILVPFALESKLSGVGRLLQPYEALWYQRDLEIEPADGQRTILHFEAVDYACQVWVNDSEVGFHKGGNLPFDLDITDALKAGGENSLVVRVEDATGGAQLRGKQVLNPGGIMYTRVSGIWQTVWLEQVPDRHIERLEIGTDIGSGEITITPTLAGNGSDGETTHAQALVGDTVVAEATGAGALKLKIDDPKLWSPASPHLYDLKVVLKDSAGNVVDEVGSYTGLREVGQERDANGDLRFTLNGETIFHWGPLDQGWWPDGLLTPPADDALIFEIQWLKDAGFNMIRKHIKVEPQRYYYHCDKIGMLVWQDQVSGGRSPRWTTLEPDPTDAQWEDDDHAQWMAELGQMVDLLDHFPSVVVWVPFNEAWGQHRTVEVGKWITERDPTRHVNIASGGNFWPVGHIADRHNYPHPEFPTDDPRFDDYIKVVGEFGGHGWPVEGHLWNESRGNWGYGGLPESLDEFRGRVERSVEILTDLKSKGVAGGVYTQTTDVEEEINGLMTYDRKEIKIPADELKEITVPLVGD